MTDVQAPIGDEDPENEPADTRRGSRRRRLLVLGAVVVAALAAVTAVVSSSGGDAPEPVAATGGEGSTTTETTAAPATPATTLPAPAGTATIATSAVPEIRAFANPAEEAAVVATMADHTDFGAPRTFLVEEQQGEWLRVLLPMRPNGSRGWIRASDVALSVTTLAIRIEVGAHRVTLFDGGQPVLESGAVVGAPETPTPTGRYFVTDPVDLRDDPGGPYGAFAFGLSGYSDVLFEFAGGPGQIALHGTNQPDQLGQDISNGCIRVPDDVILQLVERLPLGTPVEIVA